MEPSSPGKVGRVDKRKITNWALGLILVIILVAITLLIFFFLKGGETKTTGSWLAEETIATVTCTGDIDYPFFTYDNSDEKNIKINVAFDDDILKNISLVYRLLYYSSSDEVSRSINLNHAAMNENYGRDGLPADSLNASYDALDNTMQMSLYATQNDNLNAMTAKYFLLSDTSNFEYTRNNVKKNYENKGLSCKTAN